jgi:protein-S-isoprenylcysteine O-methyltransferase Ste14
MSERRRAAATTPEVRRGAIVWIVKALAGLAFFALLLGLCAGRWSWLWGWVFIGLLAAASVANALILIPTNPALLAERSRGLREEGARGWDRAITGLAAGALPLASWIVAALDVRYGWSAPVSLGLHLGGLAAVALGWGVVLWATASNAHFSTTVHVHGEGHTVQTGGPYRIVRHPGYVGAIVYQVGAPLLLGSWWALVPAALSVPLFVLRTWLEDRTLQEELAGYREYAGRVRYRLLPGVW